MSQVTFRIPDSILANIENVLDASIDEKKSDFFRKAAVDRLKMLGQKEKENE